MKQAIDKANAEHGAHAYLKDDQQWGPSKGPNPPAFESTPKNKFSCGEKKQTPNL